MALWALLTVAVAVAVAVAVVVAVALPPVCFSFERSRSEAGRELCDDARQSLLPSSESGCQPPKFFATTSSINCLQRLSAFSSLICESTPLTTNVSDLAL